jgi:hypothetical protein
MKQGILKEGETLLLIKTRIHQQWETLDHKTKVELLCELYVKIGSLRGVAEFLENFLSKTHIHRFVWTLSSKKRRKKERETLTMNIPLPQEISKNIPYTNIDLGNFLKGMEKEVIIRLKKMVKSELSSK